MASKLGTPPGEGHVPLVDHDSQPSLSEQLVASASPGVKEPTTEGLGGSACSSTETENTIVLASSQVLTPFKRPHEPEEDTPMHDDGDSLGPKSLDFEPPAKRHRSGKGKGGATIADKIKALDAYNELCKNSTRTYGLASQIMKNPVYKGTYKGCLCPSKWPLDRVTQKWDDVMKFSPTFAQKHSEVPNWLRGALQLPRKSHDWEQSIPFAIQAIAGRLLINRIVLGEDLNQVQAACDE
eukprot:12401439-Karenia_brevis.AAC.1